MGWVGLVRDGAPHCIEFSVRHATSAPYHRMIWHWMPGTIGAERSRLHPIDQLSGHWLVVIDVAQVRFVLVATRSLKRATPAAVSDAHWATVQGASETVPAVHGFAHGGVDVSNAVTASLANVG